MLRGLLFACFVPSTLACTTIIVGRKATADGSVMCTHSNDGEGASDPRLVHIPRGSHANNTMRPIFYAPENYPRYVGSARGKIPTSLSASRSLRAVGHRVAQTYSYYEETYGALNEHQVGIGESTRSGVFGTKAAGHGGKAQCRSTPCRSSPWSAQRPLAMRSSNGGAWR